MFALWLGAATGSNGLIENQHFMRAFISVPQFGAGRWHCPNGRRDYCGEAAARAQRREGIAVCQEHDGGSFAIARRRFLVGVAWMTGAIATSFGSWVIRPRWANAAKGPIKIGIATDLTPL